MKPTNQRIRDSLADDSALAIGSTKELLETVFKTILGMHSAQDRQRGNAEAVEAYQRRSTSIRLRLRKMVDGCQVPDDREALANEESRPPWPDDADEPRLTFAELIDHEALGYRAWGTPVGVFLARDGEVGSVDPVDESDHTGRARSPDGDLGRRDPANAGRRSATKRADVRAAAAVHAPWNK